MVTLCRYRPQLRDLALRARQIAFVALTGIPFGFTNGQMRFTGTVLALSKNVNFDHMDSPCHLLVVKKARLDCRVNVPCRLLTRLRCTTSASCSLMPDRCPRDTDIKDQLFSCLPPTYASIVGTILDAHCGTNAWKLRIASGSQQSLLFCREYNQR